MNSFFYFLKLQAPNLWFDLLLFVILISWMKYLFDLVNSKGKFSHFRQLEFELQYFLLFCSNSFRQIYLLIHL